MPSFEKKKKKKKYKHSFYAIFLHWVLIIVYFEAKSIKIIDPLCPNALFPNHEFVTERLKLFFKKVSDELPINE
jgi:hypothetical protein